MKLLQQIILNIQKKIKSTIVQFINVLKKYKKKFNAKLVKKNFTYSSNKNTKFLSIKELKKLILDYQKYKL